MDHLPSLEEVYVELWYRKDGDEVQHVAAALRREAEGHPNRPTLRVKRGSGARACIYQYHGPSWPSGFWIFSPNHALYSYVSNLACSSLLQSRRPTGQNFNRVEVPTEDTKEKVHFQLSS
jgi:hypothetical protein